MYHCNSDPLSIKSIFTHSNKKRQILQMINLNSHEHTQKEKERATPPPNLWKNNIYIYTFKYWEIINTVVIVIQLISTWL